MQWTQSWKYRTSAAPCMSTPLIHHTAIFSPGYKYNALTWLQCYHLVTKFSPGPSWVQAAAFTQCAIWTRWIGSQFDNVTYSLKCGLWTCYSAAPQKTCRTESGCFTGNKKQTPWCLLVLYAAGIPQYGSQCSQFTTGLMKVEAGIAQWLEHRTHD